jgi:cytochrome c oxidase cbb3-type subunit 3
MRMQPLRNLAFSALLSLLAIPASAQSFTAPPAGKQLFDALCTNCHGLNGTGDEAPALTHALGADDEALHRLIRDGAPERGMPRVRRMTEEEAAALVTYVRELGRGAPVKMAGNAQAGRAVYQRLECASCHVSAGQGGVLGPELTKVGQSRAASYLLQAVLEPGTVHSKGVQGILPNGFSEYLPVRVVSRDGSETRGLRVNEDSFTIQVRDANSKYYSFRKADVVTIDKQFTRSLMPSYQGRMTAAETDDLVAYLYSLGATK